MNLKTLFQGEDMVKLSIGDGTLKALGINPAVTQRRDH
jgi:hypothetical protein